MMGSGEATIFPLIPAKAGIQSTARSPRVLAWIPALRGDERVEEAGSSQPETALMACQHFQPFGAAEDEIAGLDVNDPVIPPRFQLLVHAFPRSRDKRADVALG